MDYKNGRIYKIINDVNDEIYVGSTTQLLCKRMATHRNNTKLQPNRKLYNTMNSLGIEHFKIILLENYPCNNREELNSREEHYRKLLNPSLNSYRCHITNDELKQYQNEKFKCEYCGCKYSRNHKVRHEKTLKHHKALEAIAPQ